MTIEKGRNVEPEAVLLKMGLELFVKTSNTTWGYFREWMKRKDVFVIGQPRAGKTTFIDYIQYGLFAEEQETLKTLKVTTSSQHTVSVGKNEKLSMTVRAVDVPGQYGAGDHARLAFEKNPHAILVFLDLSKPLNAKITGSVTYLAEFCERLNGLWRLSERKNNRLKCLVVVANKLDKIGTAEWEEAKKAFGSELRVLNEGLGRMENPPVVRPCVMIKNEQGDKLVANIVTHLAKELSK
jgi:GTPase SAR1 family protein